MVRDFIPLDSYKTKQVLKSTLDMNEGDFSGNKLGLSSKVVPVVVVGNKDMKYKLLTEAEMTNGVRTQVFDGFVDLENVNIYQTNTETDAKNFTFHCETLDGSIIETQLAILDNSLTNVAPVDFGNTDTIYEWTAESIAGYFPHGCYVKNMWVSQDSADGTNQDIKIKVAWLE